MRGEDLVTAAVTGSLEDDEQISAVVRSRVHAWTTGAEQHDDITVMVIKKSG